MNNYTTTDKVIRQAQNKVAIAASELTHAHFQVQAKLIKLLYSQGFTQQQIADHLGITRQWIQQICPKNEK